jgi:hypothetical protein
VSPKGGQCLAPRVPQLAPCSLLESDA